MRKIINTDKAPEAVGPYSQAISVNGLLFVSGQIPISPETGELVSGDIRVQTRQVLENLKAIIEYAGYDIGKTTKCTCFLKNMDDFSVFNEVYSEYFKSSLPARECVEVSRLPKNVNVEVSAICGI